MMQDRDVMAYLARLRGNADKVLRNSAAGADAVLRAAAWVDFTAFALDLAKAHPDEPISDKLRHWAQLLERINGEIRAGLHLGEAAEPQP